MLETITEKNLGEMGFEVKLLVKGLAKSTEVESHRRWFLENQELALKYINKKTRWWIFYADPVFKMGYLFYNCCSG